MSSPSSTAALARLVRLPAPFLAPADALAGFALAGGVGWPHPGVLAASALVCAAGMALNDVADRARDAVRRPERPIPSGAISARAAGVFGAALVVGALACAGSAGIAALVVAGLLTALVVGYDFVAKHWGPSAVASIALARGANVVLGASMVGELVGQRRGEVVAAGAFVYGLYAAGLVLASFGEDHATGRRSREGAFVAMAVAAILPTVYFPSSGAVRLGSFALLAWLAIPLPGMIRGAAGRFVGAGVLGYPLLGSVLALGMGRVELAAACAGLFALGAAWREMFGARVD